MAFLAVQFQNNQESILPLSIYLLSHFHYVTYIAEPQITNH